jgi:hypothetical protein
MTGKTSSSLSPLGSQAEEIIDDETDWVTLAEELNVTHLQNRDSHPEWHPATTDFRPMFLSYLWATVQGISLSRIPEELDERADLARAFGFELEEIPSYSTFTPGRIEDRFEDLQRTVRLASEEIKNLGMERGAPLGNSVSADFEADEDDNPSRRTIDRMLRRNGRRVLNEVEKTVLPSISLPRPEDPVYDEEELLLLETLSAINNIAVNQGGEELGDLKNPDPDDDDPFYKGGPTGETLLEAIKQLSVDEIADLMNFILKKTYLRAKPKLEELDNFKTNVMISLDITYVAYWGKEGRIKWLQGAPDGKEYDKCFKFATAAIVGQNSHYTVAVLPLGSSEYTDNEAYLGQQDQSYYIGDVTRQLLNIATEYVNIRMVYADREFYATDAIAALEEHNLNYIIPAPVRKELKRKVNNFAELKRGYADEERDEALYVEHDYSLQGKVKHKGTNASVSTNLVILPPEEDCKARDGAQPFITNIENVSDEIALDRRWTKRQIERYESRAAIENTYSSIKQCAAKTTSKAIEVRWFHFGFACIIYNLWLLVDFLTQERIEVIETRQKPRIKLSRFLRWVDRESTVLI